MKAPTAENFRITAQAAALGVLVSLTYIVFEWTVNHGTKFIWDDVFQTDRYRWGVIPLAIVLSVAFTWLVRAFGQRRTIPPKVDLLAGDEEVRNVTLAGIGVIFIIGVASLLAGASLGPEMSLMAMSSALGTWIATRRGRSGHPRLLALASVGALLVAFLGSLFPAVIPLLLIRKRQGALHLAEAVPILLAGGTSFVTLGLVLGHTEGYGSIPVGFTFHAGDFLTALLLGVVGTLAAFGLRLGIRVFSRAVRRIEHRRAWPVAAAAFGLGVGVLYFLGGETVQFSGSAGVQQLSAHAAGLGAASFVGLIVVKILVTAWSEATGYRGGLVFPSIYVGTAIGLLAGSLVGAWAGPGVTIGSVAGIMAAMTSPLAAAFLLFGLLPFKMLGLAIAGIVGAAVGNKLFVRLAPPEHVTERPAG